MITLESFEPGATPDFAVLGEMVTFFAAEVAARHSELRDDLITRLVHTDLSDDEVVMWCWLLLVAGLETTGNLIAAGLDLILRHTGAMRDVLDDSALMAPAVAEMLRIVTPGRYIRRTATADTEIGGHEIRAGEAVVMNFTVANYGPAMFEDPLRFDIHRRPSEALTFSWGPHKCIGAAVALVEARVAFQELLARFPGIAARGPAVIRPSLATVVVESMPVRFGGEARMQVMSAASRSPSARVQQRQQRTRAQLTRAAAAIIAEKGVEGLRLREVTDAADVGFGSFYNYFSSKEDLVEAVVLDLMSTLAHTLIAHVERLEDPAEAASAAHRWFVRNATEDPETARLMVNLDQADVQFQARILPFGRRLLESGVEQGRFIPLPSPITTLTYVVGATIAVTRAVLDGRLGPEAESQTAEVLLHALGLDADQAKEIAYRDLPSVALLD